MSDIKLFLVAKLTRLKNDSDVKQRRGLGCSLNLKCEVVV